MRIELVKTAKIKSVSAVVVKFGEHVINIVSSKQDVVSLSAPESEFYAMTSGGAHCIHTKNIFSDLQVEVTVRQETDSASASGICPRRADLGTKYLERDRIKKCLTKMEVLFAGAWVGEQLPVVSGTEILVGEDLIEGQSWTLGVVLFITVGVVLLSCVFAVIVSHLSIGNPHATREPAIAEQCSMSPRAMQDDDLHHLNVTESTWILKWYSGDQLWQLVVGRTRGVCVGSWCSSCSALPSRVRTKSMLEFSFRLDYKRR